MTAGLNNLVRLTKAQIKPAGEMFARTLQDDPLFSYFISDFEREALLPIFEFITRFGVLYGEVYATSPSLEGVAVWFPSEKAKLTSWKMIRIGGFKFIYYYFFNLRKVISRIMSYNEYAFKLHERHAHFPHWYLLLIGVNPMFQRKGYASRLLRPMFARIDQEHLPCYLETQNERNVPIYQHYGFKVVEEGTIPGTNVTHWAMLREKSS